MEHRIHLNLATTAAIITLGLVVSVITSTVVATRSFESRARQATVDNQTMSAKGSVRKRIRSDRAVWTIHVQGEAPELRDAFAVLNRGTQRVSEFLTQRGFPPQTVMAGPIDTVTHYVRDAKGQETRQVASYSLDRAYSVESKDVDRVAQAAGEVTALIEDGILVISHAPDFYYTDLPALRLELMGSASRDARARADEIARAAGCRVAQVVSAHMGVLQITRPFSTEVADGGLYDTSTIDKDVTAVVTACFRIESP